MKALILILSLFLVVGCNKKIFPSVIVQPEETRFKTTERIAWKGFTTLGHAVTDTQTGKEYLFNWSGGILEINEDK